MLTKTMIYILEHIPKASWIISRVFTKLNNQLHWLPIKLRFSNQRIFTIDLRESVFLYILRNKTLDGKNNEKILSSIIDCNDIVFDIGANIGYMSFLFIENCKFVYAFEPSKKCCNYFKKNLSSEDKIKINNVAIGRDLREIDFYEHKHLSISRTVYKDENKQHTQQLSERDYKKYKVRQISIDSFCDSNKIYPNLIKIDVEGFEAEVIIGMKEVLIKREPVLYFEVLSHRRRNNIINLIRDISGSLYNFYDIQNKLNITKISMDLGQGYILAIPKWAEKRVINFIKI